MKFSILVLGLAALLAPSVFAAPPAATPAKTGASEYKRADHNFYWKSDVLNVNSDAEIVPASGYTQQGDTYLVPGEKKKTIYAVVMNDWVEPITPPGATSLGVPTTAMQILDPQGDVQIAFPAAPALFVPVQNGMTVANGSVIRTGARGTAAVVFGGVASARLIPKSEAAVQQTLTPGLRSTEIDLTRGAVFSKVGKPIGEKEDYTIQTPFGAAAARGTDFVTVAMPTRTDVWIAEGTVQMNQPHGGPMVSQISADGGGPLKIVRFPLMPDAHDAMMASAQTMTAAMNFIPMANHYVKDLRDRAAKGEQLTDAETKYLDSIKKVPCLIKLEFVAPPPPPPAPPKPPKPAKAEAKAAGKQATAPSPAAPGTTNAAPSQEREESETKPASPAPSAPTPAASVPETTNTVPSTNAPPAPASQQPATMNIP
jgi:hypothetical protein